MTAPVPSVLAVASGSRRDHLVGQARAAVRHLGVTRRLIRWRPATVVLAAAIGGLAVWRLELGGDAAELALAAAVAIGASPTLADRAETTLASSPTSRRWRAAARLVIIVPTILVSWVVARAFALHHVPGAVVRSGLAGWVPSRDALLALAVLAVGALAVETMADPSGSAAGLGGAVAVLISTAVAAFLPPAWAVLPIEDNRWRWTGLLAGFALLLILTLADRGRPSRRRTASVTSAGGPPRRSPGARRR
jgi:hypothetical protein